MMYGTQLKRRETISGHCENEAVENVILRARNGDVQAANRCNHVNDQLYREACLAKTAVDKGWNYPVSKKEINEVWRSYLNSPCHSGLYHEPSA